MPAETFAPAPVRRARRNLLSHVDPVPELPRPRPAAGFERRLEGPLRGVRARLRGAGPGARGEAPRPARAPARRVAGRPGADRPARLPALGAGGDGLRELAAGGGPVSPTDL